MLLNPGNGLTQVTYITPGYFKGVPPGCGTVFSQRCVHSNPQPRPKLPTSTQAARPLIQITPSGSRLPQSVVWCCSNKSPTPL